MGPASLQARASPAPLISRSRFQTPRYDMGPNTEAEGQPEVNVGERADYNHLGSRRVRVHLQTTSKPYLPFNPLPTHHIYKTNTLLSPLRPLRPLLLLPLHPLGHEQRPIKCLNLIRHYTCSAR
ncbi:hypothetical protein PILCRDRAFT_651369 [Piloderma croceum F 1598]|uniref:Uncharacterized protein n=1 Tax=Piloderma croceum (strain F 1598) TaxID=765440 RepID=A0A0C3EUW3_PILCF|nr:hypothetical protein PILCRDRAFT_651369 [Piloderma croceum F 1598]